jgi:hypothetical protein
MHRFPLVLIDGTRCVCELSPKDDNGRLFGDTVGSEQYYAHLGPVIGQFGLSLNTVASRTMGSNSKDRVVPYARPA